MALRTVISSRIPMVIILGATGTGKTKLSLELAQRFGTEIISADSMQIYKGLNVVTAKATVQEREVARHHLLDILEPHQMFTVVDFRNRALKIIDNLTEQGKIPIIVGGTNYYIESIVYKILVEDMDDNEALLWDKSRRKRDFADSESNQEEEANRTSREEVDETIRKATTSQGNTEPENTEKTEEVNKDKIKEDVDNERNFTNEEIHAKLKAIDPVMAGRLHPNNRRKVLRNLNGGGRSFQQRVAANLKHPLKAVVLKRGIDSGLDVERVGAIEVWLKTGRRHSDILAEQKLSEGQLRRPGSTVILWLKCEQSVHDERLNARVDTMLKEGLIAELLDFHARHNKSRIQDGKPPDYTKGIFQTLGFKEFHEYLMLSEEERNSEGGQKLLEISIDNMKMATRRYARRQNKMVRGRFLEHPTREIPPIYELDTTDLTKWKEHVSNKAVHIIESYLKDTTCDYAPLKVVIDDEKKKIDGNSYNYCDVCDRIIIGDNVFAIHLKSFRHMKVLKKKKKEEKPKEETEKPEQNMC